MTAYDTVLGGHRQGALPDGWQSQRHSSRPDHERPQKQ